VIVVNLGGGKFTLDGKSGSNGNNCTASSDCSETN